MACYWNASRIPFVMCNYFKMCSSVPIAAAVLDNLGIVKAVAGSNKFMQMEIFKVTVKNSFIVSNISGA